MYRVLALIVMVCLLASPALASNGGEIKFAPAVCVNFDGSRHVDVSHQKQQGQKQESAPATDESLTFEKSDEAPSTLLLVGVGIAAAAAGVAAKWQSIAKTVTAVH